MVGSMGRVGGAACDNVATESFFSLLPKDVLDRRTWNTREELRIAIVTWSERAYHRRRLASCSQELTPVEYELIMKPAATQAAYPPTVTRSCSRPILASMSLHPSAIRVLWGQRPSPRARERDRRDSAWRIVAELHNALFREPDVRDPRATGDAFRRCSTRPYGQPDTGAHA